MPATIRVVPVRAALRSSQHHASVPQPLLQLLRRTLRTPSRPLPVCQAHQARWRSSSSGRTSPGEHRAPPRASIGRILLNALSMRHLFSAYRGRNFKTLFRQSPEEMTLALIILAGSAGILVYVVRIYFTYFNSEQFTRLPPPVAKSMRRALYYSNYAPDPKLALKYYKMALDQCDELRVDPFSDEVTGIKIQLAAWLEKIQNYEAAIKVLETLFEDCTRWIEVMEKSVQDGTTPPASLMPSQQSEPRQGDAPAEETPPETIWGKRTRILGKAVGISVKLGSLYSDEHVLQSENAHERLTWSVETALGELRRRATDGVKDGEGDWMSPEAMGGALESLGHSYEARSQFHLAVPLFFQALKLCQDPCHIAVLMNNLAAAFAQHPAQSSYESVATAPQGADSPMSNAATPAQTRLSHLQTAQRWAQNAHKHAVDTKGDTRTPECDEACAVALCNLGDIASLLGDFSEARRRLGESLEMSQRIDFQPGVSQAQAGLQKLSK